MIYTVNILGGTPPYSVIGCGDVLNLGGSGPYPDITSVDLTGCTSLTIQDKEGCQFVVPVNQLCEDCCSPTFGEETCEYGCECNTTNVHSTVSQILVDKIDNVNIKYYYAQPGDESPVGGNNNDLFNYPTLYGGGGQTFNNTVETNYPFNSFHQMTEAQFYQCIEEAFDYWKVIINKISGLTFTTERLTDFDIDIFSNNDNPPDLVIGIRDLYYDVNPNTGLVEAYPSTFAVQDSPSSVYNNITFYKDSYLNINSNGTNSSWTIDNVKSVMIHELGHFFGLKHSNRDANNNVTLVNQTNTCIGENTIDIMNSSISNNMSNDPAVNTGYLRQCLCSLSNSTLSKINNNNPKITCGI